MSLSERSRVELGVNPWAARVAEAQRRGGLLDLTCTNPTQVGLPYSPALAAALGAAAEAPYSPEPLGLEPARAAIAERWPGRPSGLDASRVVLCSSSSEAYLHLFHLLADSGDELLCPSPSYPLFEHLARLAGVRLRPYRLEYDGAWHLDLDSVRAACGPRTRAALLVSPNNPTGSFTTRAELAAMARLGVPILSDEVFASYPLRASRLRAESALGEPASADTLVFALGGLSKQAALPHYKLGWVGLSGPARLVEPALARLELSLDTLLAAAPPVQHALPELLRLSEPTTAALRARLHDNLQTIQAACAGSPVTLLDVEGGWSGLLRLPHLPPRDWSLSLLEHGVLTQPGWLYELPPSHLVLSLLTPPPRLREGLERLVSVVSREL